MKNKFKLSETAFQLDGRMPLSQAIPLGLQHVLAMFVGNLTPLLIITGACGLVGGEFADLQLSLLQNAMLIAGVVTLIQLFSIGPVGGKVPIIMGTSSGFIGVFNLRNGFRKKPSTVSNCAWLFPEAIAQVFPGCCNRYSGFIHWTQPYIGGNKFVWRWK